MSYGLGHRLAKRSIDHRLAKRSIDLILSGAVVLASSPVMAAIALAIWRQDGRPVLYRGVRVGRHGKLFEMYKFRTMVVDAERLGGPTTSNLDPRLIGIGRVLRRWKADELPQFLNVLKGDMSLVGPRPQVPAAVAGYTEDERRLVDVRPGITDWASIRFRDEGEILEAYADPDRAYEELIRPEKSRLGLLYVDTASVSTDLRILWGTARALVGASVTLPTPPDASAAPAWVGER